MTRHESPARDLRIVGPQGKFPKVELVEPVNSGYLLLALEVDRRPPFGYRLESAEKRHLIASLKDFAAAIASGADIREATVFKTLLRPPGRGALLKKRPQVPVARYDVVLLVEFDSADHTSAFRRTARWTEIEAEARRQARTALVLTASNARRIGPVDHDRDGVFLFNWFYSDTLRQNLDVWEYTAGWFQDQTGLDNSTLLLPEPGEESPWTVVNHCRWDGLGDILPALVFKPGFRNFVLANFEANDTAASPILYRLA